MANSENFRNEGVSGFFGELYLRSTLPFFSPEVTSREVEFLAHQFQRTSGPLLDLGCGHGRHATPLAKKLGRPVVGLDADERSLAMAEPGFHGILGDLRALPFRRGQLAGAYAWYSSLFVFDDDENALALQEVSLALAPGGLLILQTVPYERLQKRPSARFEHVLPDGARLFEESLFDPHTGVDRGQRTLRSPDGRVLHGTYSLSTLR